MPSCHKAGTVLPSTLHQCTQPLGEGRTPCLRASHNKTSWPGGYVCSYGGVVENLDIHTASATQLNHLFSHGIYCSLQCTLSHHRYFQPSLRIVHLLHMRNVHASLIELVNFEILSTTRGITKMSHHCYKAGPENL